MGLIRAERSVYAFRLEIESNAMHREIERKPPKSERKALEPSDPGASTRSEVFAPVSPAGRRPGAVTTSSARSLLWPRVFPGYGEDPSP